MSVGGRPPTLVAFFPLPEGDVVIPTGIDQDLVSSAAGHAVTVQFEQSDGAACWLIRGAGKAMPLRRRDRPPAATAGALAMSCAFQHGIRVAVEDFVGERVVQATGHHR